MVTNIFLFTKLRSILENKEKPQIPHLGFPGGSDGKESSCQHRRLGFNPWLRKIPWRRKWQPTPVLLPGKSCGWRSLIHYSPWGHKELDTTERLHSDMQMTPHLWQKQRRAKDPPDESERGERKSWLKAQHSEN